MFTLGIHPSGMYPRSSIYPLFYLRKRKKAHSDGISRNLSRERMSVHKERDSRRDLSLPRGKVAKTNVRETTDAKGRRCKRTLLPEQLGIPHPSSFPPFRSFSTADRFVSWKHDHGNSSVCISRHRHRLVSRYLRARNLFPKSFHSTLWPSWTTIPRNNCTITFNRSKCTHPYLRIISPSSIYVKCTSAILNRKYRLCARDYISFYIYLYNVTRADN